MSTQGERKKQEQGGHGNNYASRQVSIKIKRGRNGWTYSFFFLTFGLPALQSHAVTLVLQTLRRDQALDLGCLGIWLLVLAFRLDLAADDILADLK